MAFGDELLIACPGVLRSRPGFHSRIEEGLNMKAHGCLGSRLLSTALLLLTMLSGTASGQSTPPSGSFGFLINAVLQTQ